MHRKRTGGERKLVHQLTAATAQAEELCQGDEGRQQPREGGAYYSQPREGQNATDATINESAVPMAMVGESSMPKDTP